MNFSLHYVDITLGPAIASDTAFVGDSYTISFEVGSNFGVNTDWTFNGYSVEMGEKYNISIGAIDGAMRNVTLTIISVEYNVDLGPYTVIVSNALDSISGTYNLTTIEGNKGWLIISTCVLYFDDVSFEF